MTTYFPIDLKARCRFSFKYSSDDKNIYSENLLKIFLAIHSICICIDIYL